MARLKNLEGWQGSNEHNHSVRLGYVNDVRGPGATTQLKLLKCVQPSLETLEISSYLVVVVLFPFPGRTLTGSGGSLEETAKQVM